MGVIKELYDEVMHKKYEEEMKEIKKKSSICLLNGKSCEFGICDECKKSNLKSIKR